MDSDENDWQALTECGKFSLFCCKLQAIIPNPGSQCIGSSSWLIKRAILWASGSVCVAWGPPGYGTDTELGMQVDFQCCERICDRARIQRVLRENQWLWLLAASFLWVPYSIWATSLMSLWTCYEPRFLIASGTERKVYWN